jgi:hypothetical protein
MMISTMLAIQGLLLGLVARGISRRRRKARKA